MAVISMKALLETGVHFGHRTRKWNPRMKPYIFTERNGIHIIDLQQTLEAIDFIFGVVRNTVQAGGNVLFVGTKRQAQETIQLEAERCGMPYVNYRWLGGTLTNWRTIRSRIDELESLERRRDSGEFELLTKREALSMTRKIDKLEGRLGGIRDMRSLPKMLFVVDVRQEATAIHEANLLEIPVVALVDTNCDPTVVDYVIPSNDDAIRAIKLLTSTVANAVIEGKEMRKDEDLEAEEDGTAEGIAAMAGVEMTDEELLGEATLAKLSSGEYGEKEAAEKAKEAEEEKAEGEEPEAEEAEKDEPEAEAAEKDESEAEEAEKDESEAEEAEVEEEPTEEDQPAEAEEESGEADEPAESESDDEAESEDETEDEEAE